ncbi:Matrilin-2 [Lonchura striata]|uniref:Matrilin-2 n=1 Tax=Lonchura striata TaxID=40157 RepID=A0A218V5T1_9PASE|nr:Matrilin-2 [Lonchura striata domestica]
MMHLGTGTMTGLALQYAVNIAFSETEGARPLRQNVPRIIMIVTDGRPQDPVAEIAAKARNSGILIFAIGVGRVDMNTLKSIGSEPHEEHVFLVANFSQIETLTSAFQTKLCAQDLCAVEKHACEQICVNTLGSYVCQCYDGYELDADGKSCVVVDYCALDNHGCQHECVNTKDSYYCRCHPGFILNPDKRTCGKSVIQENLFLSEQGFEQNQTIVHFRTMVVNRNALIQMIPIFVSAKKGLDLIQIRKHAKKSGTVGVDHCAESNHGCEQLCLNTGDSYVCQCSEGFVINEDLKTCSRVDHCALSDHGCEHLCVNGDRSYTCQCFEGYRLRNDGKTCKRKNVCKSVNHGCEHVCVNADNSYICKCHEGFILREDGKTCRRQDICKSVSHGCEHICINKDDSYVCKCHEGFLLREDGKTCRNKDICSSVHHGCEHVCVNTDESYICQCYEGFALREDGRTCRNKDVCNSVDHGCEHICVNTASSYLCQCYEGFVLSEDKKTCKNKDICKSVNHGCEHVCVNSGDSYTCKCHDGFLLREDGKTCRNKDICNSVDHGCEQVCVNTEDSYICQCNEKFILKEDGKTCRYKDVCNSVDHGCEHICVSTGDSYVCKCHEDFILREDGKTCRNKDLCKSIDHGCEHVCINNNNSYSCQCHEGFVLRQDGRTCRSKDVCKSADHGCEYACVNNGDSYTCKCQEGYVLKEDQKTCRRCTEGPIDLVFVIDGSKSLGEDNFEIVKQFVSGILDTLEISPKAARVGLLQYSTEVRTEFTLRQFSSAKDMKKAVSQMKYMGRGSMTGLALRQMSERSFTETEGARPFSANVPRISIVFTDGRAQDEVSEWATRAKQRGIIIYAIGIGKAIEEELLEIASEPSYKHLFYAEDFTALEDISEELRAQICEGPESTTIAITDVIDCPHLAVHHKYLFEDSHIHSTTAKASKDNDQCKCENLVTFQNYATSEVRKLTQRHILSE